MGCMISPPPSKRRKIAPCDTDDGTKLKEPINPATPLQTANYKPSVVVPIAEENNAPATSSTTNTASSKANQELLDSLAKIRDSLAEAEFLDEKLQRTKIVIPSKENSDQVSEISLNANLTALKAGADASKIALECMKGLYVIENDINEGTIEVLNECFGGEELDEIERIKGHVDKFEFFKDENNEKDDDKEKVRSDTARKNKIPETEKTIIATFLVMLCEVTSAFAVKCEVWAEFEKIVAEYNDRILDDEYYAEENWEKPTIEILENGTNTKKTISCQEFYNNLSFAEMLKHAKRTIKFHNMWSEDITDPDNLGTVNDWVVKCRTEYESKGS